MQGRKSGRRARLMEMPARRTATRKILLGVGKNCKQASKISKGCGTAIKRIIDTPCFRQCGICPADVADIHTIMKQTWEPILNSTTDPPTCADIEKGVLRRAPAIMHRHRANLSDDDLYDVIQHRGRYKASGLDGWYACEAKLSCLVLWLLCSGTRCVLPRIPSNAHVNAYMFLTPA